MGLTGSRGVLAGAGLVAGVAAAAFVFGEVTHLVSSRRRLGKGSASSPARGTGRSSGPAESAGLGSAGSDQIVLVLGYRNPGERVNGINRFRVRAGLRTLDPEARSAVVIFCGGAVAGAVPEAELLDDYARRVLGFTGRSLLESSSESTWENIAKAIPLIDEELRADTSISIVSNSHHAEKARDHLWQMRPDLGNRLVRGGDYRFGELPLVKPIAAARGLLALRELDRARTVTPGTSAG